MKNNEPTTDLLHVLNKIRPDEMDRFLSSHQVSLPDKNIFSDYMAEKNISSADIYKNCQGLLSKSYVYDILNGKKTAQSRDITLILCIAAHMNRKMIRRVLENYQHRDLYPKDARDIILATFINNQIYDFIQINEELDRYHLRLLHE